MFNESFYPTPKEVIQKMLEPFYVPEPGEDCDVHIYRKYKYSRENNRLNDLTILEPSAGKGDILKFIQEEFTYHRRSKEFYCIEREPDLQHILREEGYKVLASDFLTYDGDYYFDLIVMNPPFSNGDEHLLKAWEILKEGDIICLLNSETIRNPFTERRKLLAKIIADNGGTIEHIGQAFKNAERPTDVEVCIVRLHKTAKSDKLNFDFKSVTNEKDQKLSESILNNPVATRDVVGNMILQYEKTKEYFVKYLEAIEGLKFYGKGLVTEYFDFEKAIIKDYKESKQNSYNKFTDTMKSEIWKVVISHLNIEKYMTHKVREKFHEFCQHQGCLDFTKENVADMVQMIFENRYNILENAIVDVFDIFTSYYKENRLHVEGWKTNDRWKVNRKVILPGWLEYGAYCSASDLKQYGDRLRVGSDTKFSDIDKVMCFISGTAYESCRTVSSVLRQRFERLGHIKTGDKFDNECESTFFHIKFWKKGTVHLTFKDEWLWQEFNMRACNGKNWLPFDEKHTWEESKKPKPEPEKQQAKVLQLPAPAEYIAVALF